MKSNFIRKWWVVLCAVLFIGHSLFAQQITGIITDENAMPLPGVNVVIKGTTAGTTYIEVVRSPLASQADIINQVFHRA